MEFARRGGFEPGNRYQGGSQVRRGGNRNTYQYESYFDRQGDVRLQGGGSSSSETFTDPRQPSANRSSHAQHNFSARAHQDEWHGYHNIQSAQRVNFGRGAGTFSGSKASRGLHEHRNWGLKSDRLESQAAIHGLPSKFSEVGGIGLPPGPAEPPQVRAHGYRYDGQTTKSGNHSMFVDNGHGYPQTMQKSSSYLSHGAGPSPLKGSIAPTGAFSGLHDSQQMHKEKQMKHPSFNNSSGSSGKANPMGERVQIIPQVLKRDQDKQATKDEKTTEGSTVAKGSQVTENDSKLKGEKEVQSTSDVVTAKEKGDHLSARNAPSKSSGPRQNKYKNRKVKQDKTGKDFDAPQTAETEKKNRKAPNFQDHTKAKSRTSSRQSSKGSSNVTGARRKEAEMPVSAEEMESLKALEERLREVKLYGTEKYESKSKAGGQALKAKQRGVAKYTPFGSEQAKSLVEQLMDGSYDCMVCCERIKRTTAVWSCLNCYHIFHLTCIKKWVETSTATGKDPDGWRCPACQSVSRNVPDKYKCFCGKVTDPEWKARDGITPHSCGNVCKKSRMVSHCTHTCTELCHPGPCPSCPVMISWHCPCGKKSYQIRCGQAVSRPCDNICGKMLKCGRHRCQEKCHVGPCNHCAAKVSLACFCAKEKMEETCGSDNIKALKGLILDDEMGMFTCGKVCERMLKCDHHQCAQVCHDGDCLDCPLLPENVVHCPCGKVEVKDLLESGGERKSCTDPLPCCSNVCQKRLKCGSEGKPHYCKKPCHLDACGPCDGTSMVSCRCGSTKKEVPCAGDVKDREFLCGKICKKKRLCGRHRCNTKCCVDDSHICMLVCGKKLQCGLHFCDELCHRGYCPRCWQTNFEERSCHCGKTIQEPPIPCGTPLPDCSHPCSRNHDCEHPVQHNCHSNLSCPPCPVLTSKTCMGGHETRKNVMCHIKDFSCGKKCGKPLTCGHNCDKPCHKGDCLVNGKCLLQCTTPRKSCPHPCTALCHPGEDCPNTPCNAQISVKCPCGRRSAITTCKADNVAKDNFSRFMSENIAENMHVLQSGQLDLTILQRSAERLQCDEECALAERNRRLAEAFDREDDDTRPSPRVIYSFFLQQEGEANLPFIKVVEDKLEELVSKVKKIEQTQLSHSFPPMNSTQRRLIHELAVHYGCHTQSYDQEPRRNTVVIATKESRIPPNKLSTQFTQQAPPKPMVLVGERALPLQSLRLETLEKKAKKPSGPDYFDDNYND